MVIPSTIAGPLEALQPEASFQSLDGGMGFDGGAQSLSIGSPPGVTHWLFIRTISPACA